MQSLLWVNIIDLSDFSWFELDLNFIASTTSGHLNVGLIKIGEMKI